MCSSSEAGSYLRFIDFVYHSTLGLRVIMKEEGSESPEEYNMSSTFTPAFYYYLGCRV